MNSNMTPVDWAKRPIVEKYIDFTGRAPRAELWWYMLALVVAFIVAMIIDSILGLNRTIAGIYGPVSLLLGLATFLPSIAVGVRRLHDTGRSGWWLLAFYVPWAISLLARFTGAGLAITGILGLVVLIAAVTLIVFYVMASQPGPNQYGPNPYGEGGTGPVPAE
jgi:uncharacterized membrane protein YhaH (DUF805 family)